MDFGLPELGEGEGAVDTDFRLSRGVFEAVAGGVLSTDVFFGDETEVLPRTDTAEERFDAGIERSRE